MKIKRLKPDFPRLDLGCGSWLAQEGICKP